MLHGRHLKTGHTWLLKLQKRQLSTPVEIWIFRNFDANLIQDRSEQVADRFLIDVDVQPAARCQFVASRVEPPQRTRSVPEGLPWQGFAVELRLKTRRFDAVTRLVLAIFAKPLPGVARSHARWTSRRDYTTDRATQRGACRVVVFWTGWRSRPGRPAGPRWWDGRRPRRRPWSSPPGG